MSPFRTSGDFPAFVDRSAPAQQGQRVLTPPDSETAVMPAVPAHWWDRLRRRGQSGGVAAQGGSRIA